ncbi:SapC family protein [Alteromonas sp. 1_MG-2023]|uniref:SapC family protein n=1 Tax=Alteromonas sp. 1_MG-2023 TaxID=3062669 RepID=UPI0026E192D5|nr:SapC family protein [Alteromonas sp. 1_MG-2023]MDO6566675.1 SapC family protein [Alteromonas sp. 1_MG-2023]
MPTYITLDSKAHKKLAIRVDKNFGHAAKFNLVSLGFNEIATISGCMPVVVTTDDTNTPQKLAAVVGWPEFGNLFCSDTLEADNLPANKHYSDDEQWQGHAVPLSIQTYPFNYAIEKDKLTVLFDQDSSLFTANDSASPSPLFASDGSPSATLKQYRSMLANLASGSAQATAYVKALLELELLSPLSITLHFKNGDTRESNGLMTINEEKLAQLDANTIHKLHTQGLLVAINAMMLSLRQYNRLVQLTRRAENPIVKIGLKTANL